MGGERFELTEEDIKWFDYFFESKEFAEALGIVWAYGSHTVDSFVVRCADRYIVERFAALVRKSRPVYSQIAYRQDDKNNPYKQWVCGIHFMHPFVLKIKDSGWVPVGHTERPYPKGEFNQEVFCKTYIKLHHSLSTSYDRNRDYVSPRMRVHGSVKVLTRINDFLSSKLGISKKRIQKHSRSNTTKHIQYGSKIEIPKILEYVDACKSLEKFYSLQLGYKSK
jgi:hypothetical protein